MITFVSHDLSIISDFVHYCSHGDLETTCTPSLSHSCSLRPHNSIEHFTLLEKRSPCSDCCYWQGAPRLHAKFPQMALTKDHHLGHRTLDVGRFRTCQDSASPSRTRCPHNPPVGKYCLPFGKNKTNDKIRQKSRSNSRHYRKSKSEIDSFSSLSFYFS